MSRGIIVEVMGERVYVSIVDPEARGETLRALLDAGPVRVDTGGRSRRYVTDEATAQAAGLLGKAKTKAKARKPAPKPEAAPVLDPEPVELDPEPAPVPEAVPEPATERTSKPSGTSWA